MTYLKQSSCKRFFLFVIVIFISGSDLFAQHQSVSGFGTQFEVRNYSSNGVPLLQNFYFRYSSGDRHALVLETRPGLPAANQINLGYYDDSRNDDYFYKVAHYNIPDTGIQTETITSVFSGTDVRVVSRPGPDFTFVLIGFSFRYSGEDHHIGTVGIIEEDRNDGQSNIYISFNDRNDDDVFLYDVEYAWVPDSFFLSTGEVGGVVSDNRGGDSASIPAGLGGTTIPVIRGFKFAFGGSCEGSGNEDHHIREIGVLTASTTSGDLEAYYSDVNYDDTFCWEVEWALLNRIRAIADSTNQIVFDPGSPPPSDPRSPLAIAALALVIMLTTISVSLWSRRRRKEKRASLATPI